VAFGGRALDTNGPKYINSPETIIFKKHETLFALWQAEKSIKSTDTAIVCEGYMDALSFHMAGITNAVAPLGTAFTSHQAATIHRWASKVILCFDSDDAGLRAAERACSIATAAGLEASVVGFNGGKDASENIGKDGPRGIDEIGKNTINSGVFCSPALHSFSIYRQWRGKRRLFLFYFLTSTRSIPT